MDNIRKARVVVLQRESLVAAGVPSLSVAARIIEVLDYLASDGVLEYVAISENSECATKSIGWADLLILSKHNSIQALMLSQLARRSGVKIVYDIDDWIFTFPSYSGGKSHENGSFARDIIGLADVITVANSELQTRVAQQLPGIEPVLMPNGMWVERHAEASNNCGLEATLPRVVFTNADFLKVQNSRDSILTALQVFFTRHREYTLDFFGDPFPEMFSLPFLHFTNRIPYDVYMRSLVAGGYHFAITPLGADEDQESAEFNLCKNPFKYINYGTAKVPGVYSNANIYRQCVQHARTGLLVENTFESWYGAMELLAVDQPLRNAIRNAAFEDVMNNFHVKQSAAVLKQILTELSL